MYEQKKKEAEGSMEQRERTWFNRIVMQEDDDDDDTDGDMDLMITACTLVCSGKTQGS